MDYLSQLNPAQAEAVTTTEGYIRVVAGAGSGKTKTLTARYMYLVDMLGISTANILCVTFTNKAARELRERLELALGDEEAASAVWAYTFHTACLRILRRHVDLLGFESAFTIYDEDDKKRVITNVMKKLNLDPKTFDPRTVMGMISRAKDKLMTPKQFAADAAGDYFREKVSDIYRQYEKEMKKACALDFDDIIMKTVLLLQNNPEARRRVSGYELRTVCTDQPARRVL